MFNPGKPCFLKPQYQKSKADATCLTATQFNGPNGDSILDWLTHINFSGNHNLTNNTLEIADAYGITLVVNLTDYLIAFPDGRVISCTNQKFDTCFTLFWGN